MIEKKDHWLVRGNTIRHLWWVFIIVLALTVLVQFWIGVKGYFDVDGWLGFGAAYGFFSCLLMVLCAKMLGKFLKRNADYYSDGAGDD